MGDIRFKEVSIEERDGGKRKELHVVVPADEVGRIDSEFYGLLAELRNIDTRDCSRQEIIESLERVVGDNELATMHEEYVLNRFATAAIRQCGIESVTTPGVHVDANGRGGSDFEFTISVIPKPKLKLTSVEPVRVKRVSIGVEEGDIDEQISYIASQYVVYRPLEQDLADIGDWISADVAIDKNGKRDKELSGPNRYIHVVTGEVPDGFITGMAGIKRGERRVFSFALPERNEKSRYDVEITLNSVVERILPSIDDEWVEQNLPQFESLEGLRAFVRSDLEEQGNRVNEQRFVSDVRSALEDRLVGEIPDEMYEEAKELLYAQVEKRLATQRISVEDYCRQHGVTKEEFNMNTFIQASQLLRQNLALDVLAQEKQFAVDEGEVAREKAQLSDALAHMNDSEFERKGFKKSLIEKIQREKAMQWLMETAIVD